MPLVLALTIAAMLLSTAAFAATLDFKTALGYALERSPQLGVDRERAAVQELNRRSARTKFLPSLDATATHGILKQSPRNPTDPWSSAMSLTLTETLYDNHTTIISYDIAKVNRDVADLQFLQTRDALLRDTALAYYNYSLAKTLAEVQTRVLELTRKQFASVEHQYHQGMKPKRDFLRLKSQLARTDIDVRQALIALERARTELRRLLGAPPGEELEFTPVEAMVALVDLPAAAPSLEGTYEYRLAKLRNDLSPYQVQLAKRRWWPQLNLTAGGFYSNSGYLGSGQDFSRGQSYGGSVLLTLSYNFWDWGLRRNDIEVAERQQLVSEHTFRQSSLGANAEVKNLMLDLAQLRSTYELSRDVMGAEEEVFGFLSSDYREGKVQSYDLIANLRDLLTARVSFATARYSLAGGLARYHYFSGNLYEKLALDRP